MVTKKTTKKKVTRKVAKKAVSSEPKINFTRVLMPSLKLDNYALAYALAMLMAADIMLLSIFAKFGYFKEAVTIIQNFTFSYNLSFLGIIGGMAEMAIYGLICGFVFSWIYNKLI